MFGAVADLPLVWALADVSMSLMALLNIVAILLLSKVALAVAADFNRQLDAGQRPTFEPERIPEVKGALAEGVWGE